ncbi:MAG: FkbM family methyltransferase [Myxococcaceae bacterium]
MIPFRRLKRILKRPWPIEVLRCMTQAPNGVELLAAYARVKRPQYPQNVSLRSGAKLKLESLHDLITAWIIFFRQEYDVRPSDEVIVDAGANIGIFSVYAARKARASRIVAVEPFPETLNRLNETIQANALQPRVQVVGCALSGEAGTRHMDTVEAPSQSRGLLESAKGGLPVPALRLPELFQREGLINIDLLKMDIEGSEHEVLGSCTAEELKPIQRLVMEYHPNRDKAPLFKHLQNAGLHLTRDEVAGTNSGVAHFERRQTPKA